METTLKNDFPFQMDLDFLVKKVKIDNDPSDDDFQVFSRMFHEAQGIARPKYAYAVAAVEEKQEDAVIIEGRLIRSALVRKNLDQTHRIVPYLATCGTEIDEWSHQFTDMLENYWADEIKNHILQQSIRTMRQTVKTQYFPSRDLSQMSPGSLPDYPITEQATLFSLFGTVAHAVGITLTDSFLMIPSKSISGFYFSSEVHFENCRLCPRPNCPGRSVPYQPQKS
jgi:hypothetical protein